MEVATTEAAATGPEATKRDRFSLKAWCEMRGFEPRHVLALTGAEAKALSEAARKHAAACAKSDQAEADADALATVLIPFLDKLKAIRDAAK